MGAHQIINSRDPAAIKRAAGHFDFLISTVNVKLDWNTYLATLKPKGRFHFVGATLDPLDLQLFPMIGGQYTVSASPVGAPATLQMMLEFASRHEVKPLIETYTFDQVNEAMERVGAGKAHYRVVLTL